MPLFNLRFCFVALSTLMFSMPLFAEELTSGSWHYTQTSATQQAMTGKKALVMLKEGNKRFVEDVAKRRNLISQAKLTAEKGQYPFAVVLSCMDSRGSTELIFDQGIGDIFSIRVAGNVLDKDQLAGLEFATKVVGTHLIVIMGHTRCGAVAGSCAGVKLGNLTQLLKKIEPAVAIVKAELKQNKLTCQDFHIVDKIAKQNVIDMLAQIQQNSAIIKSLVQSGEVMIVGAMHDIKTGKVEFFDLTGKAS